MRYVTVCSVTVVAAPVLSVDVIELETVSFAVCVVVPGVVRVDDVEEVDVVVDVVDVDVVEVLVEEAVERDVDLDVTTGVVFSGEKKKEHNKYVQNLFVINRLQCNYSLFSLKCFINVAILPRKVTSETSSMAKSLR